MLNRFARFSLAVSEIDRCWHKLAAEAMAEYDLNLRKYLGKSNRDLTNNAL